MTGNWDTSNDDPFGVDDNNVCLLDGEWDFDYDDELARYMCEEQEYLESTKELDKTELLAAMEARGASEEEMIQFLAGSVSHSKARQDNCSGSFVDEWSLILETQIPFDDTDWFAAETKKWELGRKAGRVAGFRKGKLDILSLAMEARFGSFFCANSDESDITDATAKFSAGEGEQNFDEWADDPVSSWDQGYATGEIEGMENGVDWMLSRILKLSQVIPYKWE